jgi:hypothetical protein
MIQPKKIKCKTCNKDCYTGKRGLCDKCHKAENIIKEKAKVKLEKTKVKKLKQKFDSIKLTTVYPLIQKVARLVGTDYCISCNSNNPTDGGHLFPKGACKSISLFILNINPQCKSCNLYFQGNVYNHAQWIIKHRGESVMDWLNKASRITYKFTKPELHEIKNLCLEVITKAEQGENKKELFEYVLNQQKKMEFYNYLNNKINERTIN